MIGVVVVCGDEGEQGHRGDMRVEAQGDTCV